MTIERTLRSCAACGAALLAAAVLCGHGARDPASVVDGAGHAAATSLHRGAPARRMGDFPDVHPGASALASATALVFTDRAAYFGTARADSHAPG